MSCQAFAASPTSMNCGLQNFPVNLPMKQERCDDAVSNSDG